MLNGRMLTQQPRMSSEALYAEAQAITAREELERASPTIGNDLAREHGEGDDIEFIDEMEGMVVGRY